MQVEKTATAKAQLAVEEACRSICQLDIDLDQQQAAAASLKTDHEAARQVDLDKQAAIAQLKKEAAQLPARCTEGAGDQRGRPAVPAAAGLALIHGPAAGPPSKPDK